MCPSRCSSTGSIARNNDPSVAVGQVAAASERIDVDVFASRAARAARRAGSSVRCAVRCAIRAGARRAFAGGATVSITAPPPIVRSRACRAAITRSPCFGCSGVSSTSSTIADWPAATRVESSSATCPSRVTGRVIDVDRQPVSDCARKVVEHLEFDHDVAGRRERRRCNEPIAARDLIERNAGEIDRAPVADAGAFRVLVRYAQRPRARRRRRSVRRQVRRLLSTTPE